MLNFDSSVKLPFTRPFALPFAVPFALPSGRPLLMLLLIACSTMLCGCNRSEPGGDVPETDTSTINASNQPGVSPLGELQSLLVDRGSRVGALSQIAEHYAGSPELLPVLESVDLYASEKQKAGFYERIIEHNQDVRIVATAKALFVKSVGLKHDVARQYLVEVMAEHSGAAFGQGTLEDVLAKPLFALKHLGVGKPVAEITAPDIDGNVFSLSDYRGKVVMLNFWGNW